MKKLSFLFIISLFIFNACKPNNDKKEPIDTNTETEPEMILDIAQANRLASLPIACIEQEYPNKLNQTISGKEELLSPQILHPAFYGCFDWHSSIHGHWSLIHLLKEFPNLDKSEIVKQMLAKRISSENILKEMEYFKHEHNKTFERTYGWAWLLKLAEELYTWDTPYSQELYKNLSPLSNMIADMYTDFLPKLNYPIRVGTHTNTAFGLCFAYDFANTTGNDSLKSAIEKRARDFYLNDRQCPMNWEPGGYDFLSPCLEEADIMRRVLSKDEFSVWIQAFLPQLSDPQFKLKPGIVSDRTDGHLVHLDGLNFSRAWCLNGIANTLPEYQHLHSIANEHIAHSITYVTDGNYEGGHWLASFAIYALNNKE